MSALLLLTLGCRPDAATDTAAGPGAAMLETPGGALLSDGGILYVVDAVVGELSRVDPETGAVAALSLGGGPTRLVGGADGMYISLRGAGAIVAVVDDGGVLTETGRAELDGEPYGLALSPDGETLYAARSLAGEVVALDTATLTIQQTWPVPDEPRWLARSPDGESLVVASALHGTLSHIDLDTGTVTDLPLPALTGQKLHSESMRAGDRRVLSPRITGDLDFSDDGAVLAVPLLLVDTAPTEDNADTSYADEGLIPGSNRFSGGVIELPVQGGLPDPDGARLLGIRSGNSTHTQVSAFFGSYPSAAVYAPGERVLWVPMEGSRAVVTLDADEPLDARDYGAPYFELRPMAAVAVDAGPCGVAFDGGAAFAYSFLDQHVTALPVDDLAGARVDHAEAALADLMSEALDLEETFDIVLPEAIWITHDPDLLEPLERLLVSDALEAELGTGLTLFYTANDGRMGQEGADVSCTTCHAEGRTDGQTWHLTVGPRQTPSLSGQIGDTAPFTWSSDVATIADEARNTSVRRMGGVALSTNDLGRLEDVIAQLRRVQLPEVTQPEAAARGAVLFERAGCDACHAGETLADADHYDILSDSATNTPTLRGIATTAPYLHDGSAETLLDVLTLSDAGMMGNTAGFTDAERAELVAYLETL